MDNNDIRALSLHSHRLSSRLMDDNDIRALSIHSHRLSSRLMDDNDLQFVLITTFINVSSFYYDLLILYTERIDMLMVFQFDVVLFFPVFFSFF